MIKTKADMYPLYLAGAFGNKLQTWATLEDFYEDSVEKNVVLRYKGKAGGAWVAYELPPSKVRETVEQWVSEGADPKLITLNESAPDDLLLIQGEVMASTHFLSLRYSRLPLPMRKALAEKQYHLDGIKAVLLLRHYLDSDSFDDLMGLLDTYPDSVVEFSTWAKDVGNVPHRNTVVWEVRNY